MPDNGYPTDDELEKVEKWEFGAESGHTFDDFMEYVKSIGNYWPRESFGWRQEGSVFFISTGGWSGNESIISAMQNNFLFWGLCWQKSERGGHFVFELPLTYRRRL